jgi:isopropylmalate/homocitrate/citramalate synthase
VKNDTEASIEVTKEYKNARIHIFLATSDEHVQAKF